MAPVRNCENAENAAPPCENVLQGPESKKRLGEAIKVACGIKREPPCEEAAAVPKAAKRARIAQAAAALGGAASRLGGAVRVAGRLGSTAVRGAGRFGGAAVAAFGRRGGRLVAAGGRQGRALVLGAGRRVGGLSLGGSKRLAKLLGTPARGLASATRGTIRTIRKVPGKLRAARPAWRPVLGRKQVQAAAPATEVPQAAQEVPEVAKAEVPAETLAAESLPAAEAVEVASTEAPTEAEAVSAQSADAPAQDWLQAPEQETSAATEAAWEDFQAYLAEMNTEEPEDNHEVAEPASA